MSDVKVWSAVTITDKVMQDRPCPDYFVAEGDYDALREDVARLRVEAISIPMLPIVEAALRACECRDLDKAQTYIELVRDALLDRLREGV